MQARSAKSWPTRPSKRTTGVSAKIKSEVNANGPTKAEVDQRAANEEFDYTPHLRTSVELEPSETASE